MHSSSTKPAIAAHRGWHADGTPENTIASLERARAGGVDRVELDVRRLGDGTLVVHHDAHVDGVALERLDADIRVRHPQIPTLDAWARRAAELDVVALAEVKSRGYERETVEILRRHLGDGFELMSFDATVVRRLRAHAPDRPVGLLSEAPKHAREERAAGSYVQAALAANASFVGLHLPQATGPVLDAASRAGLGVAVWTVEDPAELVRLLADERVTTVITDAPDRALELRGRLDASAPGAASVRLLGAALAVR